MALFQSAESIFSSLETLEGIKKELVNTLQLTDLEATHIRIEYDRVQDEYYRYRIHTGVLEHVVKIEISDILLMCKSDTLYDYILKSIPAMVCDTVSQLQNIRHTQPNLRRLHRRLNKIAPGMAYSVSTTSKVYSSPQPTVGAPLHFQIQTATTSNSPIRTYHTVAYAPDLLVVPLNGRAIICFKLSKLVRAGVVLNKPPFDGLSDKYLSYIAANVKLLKDRPAPMTINTWEPTICLDLPLDIHESTFYCPPTFLAPQSS